MENLEAGCENCRRLQREAHRLVIDRQRLVEELAAERERSNALFVSYPRQGPAPAASPPSQSSPEPWSHGYGRLPLRYQLVDAVNTRMKRLLPGFHGAGRRLVESYKRRRK